MIYLKAFLVGGIICVLGQLLINFTKMTTARILVTFVVLGTFLGALGIYEPIAKWGGEGAMIPLTGFGYALAKGVMKGVAEKGWMGVLAGGMEATAAGVSAAILFGWLNAVIFTPKTKR